MSRPSRDTVGGRAYLDLRARARREGRPTDELLVLYILERFLFRVSISDYRDRLVLKDGMLLAALDERRPTADVDLLAEAIDNDIESITAMVREVQHGEFWSSSPPPDTNPLANVSTVRVAQTQRSTPGSPGRRFALGVVAISALGCT